MSDNEMTSLQDIYDSYPKEVLELSKSITDTIMVKAKNVLGSVVEYKELIMMYNCAIKEIRTKFDVLNTEFNTRYQRNPIASIKTRVKSNSSIVQKLERKGLPFNVATVERELNDIAGIRVVCSYEDDIYRLADALTSQDDITLIKMKDYIKNPKPNGYRSLHMIVSVPVFFANGKREMKAEVQIRTIAMDFWASLEHNIKYKQDVTGQEDVVKRLKECADTIAKTDIEMMNIRRQMESLSDAPTEDELLFEKLSHFDEPII